MGRDTQSAMPRVGRIVICCVAAPLLTVIVAVALIPVVGVLLPLAILLAPILMVLLPLTYAGIVREGAGVSAGYVSSVALGSVAEAKEAAARSESAPLAAVHEHVKMRVRVSSMPPPAPTVSGVFVRGERGFVEAPASLEEGDQPVEALG